MKSGIEWQVSSLAPSQKLKALGVKQKSYFVWGIVVDPFDEKAMVFQKVKCCLEEQYAAFTVAELGEMLPKNIWQKNGRTKERYYLNEFWMDDTGNPVVVYKDQLEEKEDTWRFIEDATEADARAKMLIYLLENNLITV